MVEHFHLSPLFWFLGNVSHLLLAPFAAYSIVISLPLYWSSPLFFIHYSLPIVCYYYSFPIVLCIIVRLILYSFSYCLNFFLLSIILLTLFSGYYIQPLFFRDCSSQPIVLTFHVYKQSLSPA